MSDAALKALEKQLGVAGFARRVETALAAAADRTHAPAVARTLLQAAATVVSPPLAEVWRQHAEGLLRVLTTLCGAAPFFAPLLTRYPEWLLALASGDLSLARTASDYAARLAAWLDRVPPGEESAALRRFKYFELARITVRELSADLVPEDRAGEILAELSHLADALLGESLAIAGARVASSCGPPQWTGPAGQPVSLGLFVLGLGKLGSEELNYSSDVDLIYVFESRPGDLTGGPSDLSPTEYFTRVAREFGRLVGESTADGFLYRIDLDLRPEGSQGPLVVSSDMLANYYELWAATWEKAAFMKARPVAGDSTLGWRTIRAISPMIYRSTMDFGAVAAIKEMKEKIEDAKGRTGDAFNVKIGAGGIRDVEFVAQALQLLHGGRIPEVRGRSTQRAIESLMQVGVLPIAQSADLLAAYRFLRRTENRIQMEGERQTHRVPEELAGRERLARALGFLSATAVADFDRALAAHRARVQEIFAALFHDQGSERVLALFSHSAPQLLASPATRELIEDLAGRFAREIDASPDPERAMNNLDRFIRGVGRRRFYYELLLDRPELVPRLAALFAASEYLSGYFATHPRLIEPIFNDPTVLLLSRAQLIDDLAAIRRDLARERERSVAEIELDALRLFRNRALINVGLLDLAGKVTPLEAEHALTEIAEVCVEAALQLAQSQVQRRAGDGEFLVVGMGKLASHELTYGSDLDVIFLYDLPGADAAALVQAQEDFVRVAQKLIWALQTRTTEGTCYAIDARLRPSGQQGMLVSSLASFERYHASSAQVWERQALLRARPIAGSTRLGRAFEAQRLAILRRPLEGDVGAEIHRIRLRTENELARESSRRHDFKTGRGGMHDVEGIVQFLQLQHGAAHARLFEPAGVATQLERLEHLGVLPQADAEILRTGWEFLQRLSSRLRIVENRSISDLDEERGDLDALARRLGYSAERAGGARRALLDDYRHHTEAIRAVYLKVLGVG
ncbi:MAG TPA: hypothetical protein VL403_02550 [Candidatus Kryptonia bacterium]|nr:hypothetical protein [Candidatus Kryptonia bacterium]